ncbi:MAG: GNAT family N-acetyltransferase [Bacteroidetes bacterium]|nr:GNAT family N-acetyltransferase [Bacteroidota bacterium]MDA1120148.1 GNAT family N-acetyltransferase [Bacteroidota bacterium]
MFDLQPTLENDLIFIRPLSREDVEPLYQVAKDPLIWEQHPCWDRFKREVYEAFFQESLESKGALLVIDKSTNEAIGSSRFKRIDGDETAIEIGWSFLGRNYWGGTYNKSLKQLMIEYAFNNVQNIVFYIGENNLRSRKAAKKIGAKEVTGGEFEHLIKRDGINLTYLLSRKDWHTFIVS